MYLSRFHQFQSCLFSVFTFADQESRAPTCPIPLGALHWIFSSPLWSWDAASDLPGELQVTPHHSCTDRGDPGICFSASQPRGSNFHLVAGTHRWFPALQWFMDKPLSPNGLQTPDGNRIAIFIFLCSKRREGDILTGQGQPQSHGTATTVRIIHNHFPGPCLSECSI